MGDDVHPLPLTDDDDDFFSDLGGDIRGCSTTMVGTGSRLVIDVENNSNTTYNTATTNTTSQTQHIQQQRHSRTNPFGTTEVRARSKANQHNNHNNSNHQQVALTDTNCNNGGAENELQVQQRVSSGNGQDVDTVGSNDDEVVYSTAPSHNNYYVACNNHNNSHSADNDTSPSFGISSHCHVPRPHEENNTVRNQLIAISIVTTLFGIGEAIGAYFSDSLAIGTDVMHLASDLLSFIISLGAVYLAKKNPTSRLPWGFHRAEVLGALLSVFIIWVVTGVLVYLAVVRVTTGSYKFVKPDEMLYTSIAGVVFNIVMALVLNVEIFKCKVSHGHSHDDGGHGHSHGNSRGNSNGARGYMPLSRRKRGENEQLTTNTDDEDIDETHQSTPSSSSSGREKNIVIRAAFVHVLGDLIQSIGVLVAALIIKFKSDEKYRLADPICTFTFSILVLITTITVIRDAFFILMEGSPKKIPYDSVYNELMQLEGVKSVHSLKMWSLTSNEVNASVHLAVDPNTAFPFELVSKANKILRDGDVVTRSTVQIEAFDEANSRTCTQCLHPGPSRASLVI